MIYFYYNFRKENKDAPAEKMEVDEKKDEKEKEKDKKEEKKEEPTFEILQNPCRVVRPQLNVISMEEPTKFKVKMTFFQIISDMEVVPLTDQTKSLKVNFF